MTLLMTNCITPYVHVVHCYFTDAFMAHHHVCLLGSLQKGDEVVGGGGFQDCCLR